MSKREEIYRMPGQAFDELCRCLGIDMRQDNGRGSTTENYSATSFMNGKSRDIPAGCRIHKDPDPGHPGVMYRVDISGIEVADIVQGGTVRFKLAEEPMDDRFSRPSSRGKPGARGRTQVSFGYEPRYYWS